MGDLTYDQLSDRLARGELGGDFFLKSEDVFLRDEALRLLTESHLVGGSPDFDLDQIDGDDVDPADLASRLAMPPMLSPYRVVVIRAAQGLTPTGRSVVETALAEKVGTRVIVVDAQVPKGSKAKFYTMLARRCTVIELRAPRPSELPGWLAERARSVHGVELDMKAAQLLAGAIGGQPGALAQELGKLVDYVEPRKSIGADEVRSAVGSLPQVDRWAWVDAVIERRFEEALGELPLLIDSGEGAVALIASTSEAVLRIGLALDGERRLSGTLKRDGSFGHLKWKIPFYVKAARAWSEPLVDAALRELLRADRLIKSGGLTDRAALEEALLRLHARTPTGNGT